MSASIVSGSRRLSPRAICASSVSIGARALNVAMALILSAYTSGWAEKTRNSLPNWGTAELRISGVTRGRSGQQADTPPVLAELPPAGRSIRQFGSALRRGGRVLLEQA